MPGSFEDANAAYEQGDYARALRLWRSAAEQGNAIAQFNLGMMYDNGRGVPQNYIQAHMWFNIAAAGVHDALRDAMASHRDRVALKMTREQIAKAQELARAWMMTD